MKKTFKLLVVLSATLLTSSAYAQNSVGIGTTTPNSKTVLDLHSTDQGFRMPRLTTADTANIGASGNADKGIMFYDTTAAVFWFYNGLNWDSLSPRSGGGTGSGIFSTIADTVVASGVSYADADFVFGSPSLNNPNDGAHYSRFFFSKSKSAFRAGYTWGTAWDYDSLGTYSVALGNDVKATGTSSVSLGDMNTASGDGSFAAGGMNIAQNMNSVAMGRMSEAKGDVAVALGHFSMASGMASLALASGNANADNSVAIGSSATANSSNSFVIGNDVKSRTYSEIVLGFNNDTTGMQVNEWSWQPTDRLLTIGNGEPWSTSSNAMVMLKNGNTTFYDDFAILGDSLLLNNLNGGYSSGQVLTVDANGFASWQAASGTNLFTDSLTTTTDSATVLMPANGAHQGIVLNYHGEGYLAATAPDGQANGGDARGKYSVDWQSQRSNPNEVAAGDYNTISGGSNNQTTDFYSTVAGGSYNQATGYSSTIAGGFQSKATNSYTTVAGGFRNDVTGQYGSVGAGASNKVYGYASRIGGGRDNIADGDYTTIPGGGYLLANAYGETVIGLYNDTASSSDRNNIVNTDRLFTIGNGTTTSNRSNALEMLKNGNTSLYGALRLENAGGLTLNNGLGGDDATIIPGTHVLNYSAPGSHVFVVDNDASETGTDGFYIYDDNTSGDLLFYVQEEGRVGINNPTPGARLDVDGSLAVNDSVIYLRSSGDQNQRLQYYGASNMFDGIDPDGPGLIGYSGGILGTTNGGEQAVLQWNHNGNVGIGITNPSTRLHVNGGDVTISDASRPVLYMNHTGAAGFGPTIEFQQAGTTELELIYNTSADELYIWETSGAAAHVTFEKSGNTGFGTTNPTEKVEINGNLKADTLKSDLMIGPWVKESSVAPSTGFMKFGDMAIVWGTYNSSQAGAFAITNLPFEFINTEYQITLTPNTGPGGCATAVSYMKALNAFESQTFDCGGTRRDNGGSYIAIGRWR